LVVEHQAAVLQSRNALSFRNDSSVAYPLNRLLHHVLQRIEAQDSFDQSGDERSSFSSS
jgi:hypothetical protein